MKNLGATLIAAAMMTSACGSDGPSAQDCPVMAAEFRAYIGENDNPAPRSLPTLSARWDDIYSELGTLRKTSRGEVCSERLPTIKREVQGIDDLSYGLQEYDPASRAGEPEEVRAYLEDKQLDDPDGRRAADKVDRLAPAAEAVLGTAFEAADSVDPGTTGAVRDALADVKELAADDPAVQAWLRALEQLDVGEYDEP
jgi:hypothetical protein